MVRSKQVIKQVGCQLLDKQFKWLKILVVILREIEDKWLVSKFRVKRRLGSALWFRGFELK
jgi:hypothetical protein